MQQSILCGSYGAAIGTDHSLGGMIFTIPLFMPQHSTLFKYASKSWNSSKVGLNTGMPRCAQGSSSGLSLCLPSERGDGGKCALTGP